VSTPSFVEPGNCADCHDWIGESERASARICTGCHEPLHAECAMLFEHTAEDFCEPCLIRREVKWRLDENALMWALDKVADKNDRAF
jgi:hypothetical protein